MRNIQFRRLYLKAWHTKRCLNEKNTHINIVLSSLVIKIPTSIGKNSPYVQTIEKNNVPPKIFKNKAVLPFILIKTKYKEMKSGH